MGEYQEILIPDRCWLKKEIDYAYSRVLKNLDVFKKTVPAPSSVQGVYESIDNTDWTAAFWIGLLWLCNDYSKNSAIEETIKSQLESFIYRLNNKIELQTHDVGFLYTLSVVNAWMRTKEESLKELIAQAAECLMERFNPVAGVLQAWGDMNDPSAQGRMIVDCLMNLPLLYVASEITGNPKFRDAANSHLKSSEQYLVRDDGTTYHTYYMDIQTGKPLYGKTHQGYSDDSCWARGQAWAVYGFTRNYIHTGDKAALELACKTADYFLTRLPEDKVCYWDLLFTDGAEPRDSSAAAILAGGLLELANQLPISDSRRIKYQNCSVQIIEALGDNYTTKTKPTSNGLLQHGVYAKPENRGVDECCIWGDYFYLETLLKMYQPLLSCW